jgi:hypothetical protein
VIAPGRPAQEPPEVTWLDPLPEDGGEDVCSPPDPLVPVPVELLAPDPDEPEPAEPEPEEPDPEEPDPEEPEVLCRVPDVPGVDEDDWACAAPGSV